GNKRQKAIGKGVPRAGFVIEAALQQSTVPVAGWHGRPQDEAKRNLQDILPRPNHFQKSVFSLKTSFSRGRTSLPRKIETCKLKESDFPVLLRITPMSQPADPWFQSRFAERIGGAGYG